MRYWYVIAIFLFTQCGKELLESDPVGRGVLPVSPYVAIGGSETAGFADGALHRFGQQNSYPALIAEQLRLVGGGAFTQPLTFDTAGVGVVAGRTVGRLLLLDSLDCTGNKSIQTRYNAPTPNTVYNILNSATAGPYNNLALPGLRAVEINDVNIIASNPYFYRLDSDTTLGQMILDRAPNLFTLWLGTDDLLDAAIGHTSPLAPIQYYNYLKPLLDSLTQDITVVGFMATVPDITTFPYFNAIPYNGLLLTQAEADNLNQQYAAQGITFRAGENAYVVQDRFGTIRPLQAGEKLMLSIPQDSLKCAGWGASTPIAAQYMLDATEVQQLRAVAQGYNGMVTQLALENRINLVDLESLYARLNAGSVVQGLRFSNQYLYGGFFSMDGKFPSRRGAALIANEFIKEMNNGFRAAIPLVSIEKQPGIEFP